MSRYNRHRRDSNHKDIVECLRKLGCSVRDCSQLGDDGPDILCGTLGKDFQVEIKSPGETPTYEQQEYHNEWRGQRPVVIWTVEQAVAWVAEMRRRILDKDED